jgi:hypothetical protein
MNKLPIDMIALICDFLPGSFHTFGSVVREFENCELWRAKYISMIPAPWAETSKITNSWKFMFFRAVECFAHFGCVRFNGNKLDILRTELEIDRDDVIQTIITLTNLNRLKHLKFYFGKTTELPCLDRLTSLQILDCSYNKLIELPDLSKLTNLKELRVFNNQLTKLPDLSTLTNLEELWLDNNQLQELPNLDTLTRLNYLTCRNNELTQLPDLSKLKNLAILICKNNNLTRFPDLRGLKKLTTVMR